MWSHHSAQQSTAVARGSSSRTLAPEEMAGRWHNMTLTEDGGMRTVVGPVEYRPSEIEGEAPIANVSYTDPLRGLFHAVVGDRELLIGHWGAKIYLFEPWDRRWRVLVGIDLASVISGDVLNNRTASTPLSRSDGRPQTPTQFVAMPNGVVIIPSGDRAYFTDGRTILPLGYDRAPAPPRAYGPKIGIDTTSDNGNTAIPGEDALADADEAANEGGYSHLGRDLPEAMGNNRLGTIRNDAIDTEVGAKKANPLGGILEDGEWRALLQWQDHFGNISPASGLSDPVRVHTENNITKDRKKDKAESSDVLRFQGAWGNLQAGPPGTVGRVLGRSRDLRNSGIPGTFQVPNYAAAGLFASVTIPDNATTTFPDNIPDSWLLLPTLDVVPVPRMTVAAQFDGRLWVNDQNNPGLLRWSRPFQWGTFERDAALWVDTQGNEITGVLAVAGGLLVMTETSTALVTPNDAGEGYVRRSLHPSSGCVASDTLRVLPGGLAVWLGREGFFGYTGEGMPMEISGDIKDDILTRLNRGRRVAATAAVDPRMGEYRCAIAVDGSPTNNLMVVYTPSGWSTRDDVHAAALCTLRGPVQSVLALGSALVGGVRHNSIWCMDHDGAGTRQADPAEAVFETVWLRNSRSQRAATPLVARFWLRATRRDQLTFEVFRDGRKYPAIQTSSEVQRWEAGDRFTPFWSETVLGGRHEDRSLRQVLNHYWTRRQLFWVKEDVDVPAAETVRFRLRGVGDWELMFMVYDEVDSYGGGTKQQRGS